MKKLLAILTLSLLWSEIAYSKTIVLHCPQIVFGKDLGSIYLINTINEDVGRAYIDKNKQMNVYNWWYKNIIFEEKKIIFNDPARSGFGVYVPQMAWLAKTEINRVNLKENNYEKDTSFEYYLDRYSYLPDFIGTKLAKKQAKWNWVSENKCKKYDVTNYKNINFISKEEWENQQKEQIEKESKPKF